MLSSFLILYWRYYSSKLRWSLFFLPIGKKKGQGPTRNLKLAKEFKGGERYEIGWLNGRPVGPHARDLINECTKLVRAQQNVSLKFTNWKKVPYINKRKLFDKVLVSSIIKSSSNFYDFFIIFLFGYLCLILL